MDDSSIIFWTKLFFIFCQILGHFWLIFQSSTVQCLLQCTLHFKKWQKSGTKWRFELGNFLPICTLEITFLPLYWFTWLQPPKHHGPIVVETIFFLEDGGWLESYGTLTLRVFLKSEKKCNLRKSQTLSRRKKIT